MKFIFLLLLSLPLFSLDIVCDFKSSNSFFERVSYLGYFSGEVPSGRIYIGDPTTLKDKYDIDGGCYGCKKGVFVVLEDPDNSMNTRFQKGLHSIRVNDFEIDDNHFYKIDSDFLYVYKKETKSHMLINNGSKETTNQFFKLDMRTGEFFFESYVSSKGYNNNPYHKFLYSKIIGECTI